MRTKHILFSLLQIEFTNMRLLIPVLLSSLLWFSCNEKESPVVIQEVSNDTTGQQLDRGISFLALGDSYTIGQSVDSNKRWPVLLAKELTRKGYNPVALHIIARTGWTTSDLTKAIEEENPEGPFNLISLLIGVNNQYRNQSPDTYRLEFRELLQQAIGFAGNKPEYVLVVSIPDYSVTPFAERMDTAKIAREIDLFNDINKEETLEAGIAYVNVTPISRAAKYNPVLIAEDGLHPSGIMYAQWVDLMRYVVLNMLEKQFEEQEGIDKPLSDYQ
jgi:lysophospholipase L1-like esterase